MARASRHLHRPQAVWTARSDGRGGASATNRPRSGRASARASGQGIDRGIGGPGIAARTAWGTRLCGPLKALGLRRMEEAEAGKVSTCVVLARWSRLSRLARERHRGPAQGYRCSSCFRACLKPQEGFVATWIDLNPRFSPNFSGYRVRSACPACKSQLEWVISHRIGPKSGPADLS